MKITLEIDVPPQLAELLTRLCAPDLLRHLTRLLDSLPAIPAPRDAETLYDRPGRLDGKPVPVASATPTPVPASTSGKQRVWSTGLTEEALPFLERMLSSPGAFPRSSVLCLATLGEPIRNDELRRALGIPFCTRLNDSDRDEHSNYGWPLSDIERLEPPLPASGAQMFWPWVDPR